MMAAPLTPGGAVSASNDSASCDRGVGTGAKIEEAAQGSGGLYESHGRDEVMGEATGPIRPLSEMGGDDLDRLRIEEASREFRKAQSLYRRLLAGETVPPVEVIENTSAVRELDWAIRAASRLDIAAPVLDSPPLAAVPEPPGRHRRREPSRSDRPLMTSVRRDATVTWLPGAEPPAG